MKYSLKFFSVVTCAIVSVVFCASYSRSADSVGTSSGLFLKKSLSARAAGMGDAFTAISDDMDAALYNPGALGFLWKPELAAMYQSGLADISQGTLSRNPPKCFP